MVRESHLMRETELLVGRGRVACLAMKLRSRIVVIFVGGALVIFWHSSHSHAGELIVQVRDWMFTHGVSLLLGNEQSSTGTYLHL